jgi:hypothetical protein
MPFWVLVWLLLIFLLGLIIGLLLAFWFRRHEPPPPPPPPYTIPDNFGEGALVSALVPRLAGTPSDGSRPASSAPPDDGVVWVDAGDEVLVHLSAAQVRILDGTLLVSIDLETDQTGRTPLTVALALGSATDPAGLVAVTDEFPRGNGQLAARWGPSIQAAVWSSLLGLSKDHAAERSKAPRGISAAPGLLSLHADAPLVALASEANP